MKNNILDAPEEETPTLSLNVKENETVKVRCNVPKMELDSVRWYKVRQQICVFCILNNEIRAA